MRDELRPLARAALDLADRFTPARAGQTIGVPLVIEEAGPRAVAVVPDDAPGEASSPRGALGLRCVRMARLEAEGTVGEARAYWASVHPRSYALTVFVYSSAPFQPPLATFTREELEATLEPAA